ncbi:aspartate carbamoyltransferase catalytic subunit [Thalassobacillus sp. CUG 92003]|uniref:aspartate carbamoyltransferase catalytic subunit n=1 Tax=Thalassobacillus sp. CUG 92003 TaxID=2736641 RepID=UPI0015E68BC2|nr:aspartate carbamoyltransferase catalytic subunit [Thalassobacillus sp. CUG 92003]
MKHFISVEDLSPESMYQLFSLAESLETKKIRPKWEDYFAVNVFLEPSTRTRHSFQMAEQKLGINVLNATNEDCSMTKGESLLDTIKTFEALGAHFAVIRQSETGALQSLADHISLPIINAGDGTGEHPTQSLLDLYTIYKEFGTFHQLKVTIAGDIKHSRVARSNAYMLKKLGAHIQFAAKPAFREPERESDYLSMDEAVKDSDVLMLLRIQHERHDCAHHDADYLTQYGLTLDREKQMKDHAIILHPAPVNRGVEIEGSLVESQRSRIFKQMTNGVHIRMALIHHILKEEYTYENSFQERQAT